MFFCPFEAQSLALKLTEPHRLRDDISTIALICGPAPSTVKACPLLCDRNASNTLDGDDWNRPIPQSTKAAFFLKRR